MQESKTDRAENWILFNAEMNKLGSICIA